MLPHIHSNPTPLVTPAQQAVEKFFAFTDDAHAPAAVCRRIFFELLRVQNFTLTRDEIETCEAISTLLADLERVRTQALPE